MRMKPFIPPHRESERGSVLIYIFIAIAVLAALSFAVSRSGRESAQTINKERADLWATELFDYSNMLRRAVTTLTITGLTENDVCFHDSGWGDNSYQFSTACPTANLVFSQLGGGATFQNPNYNLLDSSYSTDPAYKKWHITGANSVAGVGTDCSPTGPCNELLAVLPFVRREACIAVNSKLGITDDLTEPPQDDAGFDLSVPFKGSYPNGESINTATLDGKRVGCFKGNGGVIDDAYVFYSVLIAR